MVKRPAASNDDVPIYDFGKNGYTYRIDCSGNIIFLFGDVKQSTINPLFGLLIRDAKQARQLQNVFEDIEDSFHMMEDFENEENR